MANRILDYQSPKKPRSRPRVVHVLVVLFFLFPSILMALAILIIVATHYR
jgi:hypothetical protein